MGAKTDVNVVHFAELPTEERTSREYGTPPGREFHTPLLESNRGPGQKPTMFQLTSVAAYKSSCAVVASQSNRCNFNCLQLLLSRLHPNVAP